MRQPQVKAQSSGFVALRPSHAAHVWFRRSATLVLTEIIHVELMEALLALRFQHIQLAVGRRTHFQPVLLALVDSSRTLRVLIMKIQLFVTHQPVPHQQWRLIAPVKSAWHLEELRILPACPGQVLAEFDLNSTNEDP